MDINTCMQVIKREIESAIITSRVGNKMYENGAKAKEGYIRSSRLIGHLHEVVKQELKEHSVIENNIFPPIGQSSPEIKLAGYFKQKKQDITVIPSNTPRVRTRITWGPLSHENNYDSYGVEYSRKCLVINVRSQLSSLAKNYDTLFERTFAEPLNLHLKYNDIVLGEVYLIPVYEYNQEAAQNNEVQFSRNVTNLEKYISFFHFINGRNGINDEAYKYEKCALVVVDFSKDEPIIYNSTQELKDANLIRQDFNLELNEISFSRIVDDLLAIYDQRFSISDIVCENVNV